MLRQTRLEFKAYSLAIAEALSAKLKKDKSYSRNKPSKELLSMLAAEVEALYYESVLKSLFNMLGCDTCGR